MRQGHDVMSKSSMKKIGFQGKKGAYSEEALFKTMKALGIETFSSQGYDDSEDVCEALEKGAIDHAILPVENSIAGLVSLNLDLLYARKFFATTETYLEINHHLLARPGVSIDQIKEVRSHPIALAQCHEYLKRKHMKGIPIFDTAGAAEELSKSAEHVHAAIAGKWCADVYGLKIIDSNIQDQKKNITRFLMIKNDDGTNPTDHHKISLAFQVDHHPGALAGSLEAFHKYGINLTKIESRPIPSNPFAYVFFVDFMGNLELQSVKDGLAQLSDHTLSWKILGAYRTVAA